MLDPQLRAFLEGGLGIHIGTRTAALRPNGARVAAVRTEDDGVHLTVYVAEVAARRVVPDLEANGAAAVVFARPADDRACQIKGAFAGARPADDDERSLIEEQWNRFLANLEQIGIPRAATSGWIIWPAVAVRLRATRVFDQSPGAGAGTVLAG